MVKAKVSVVVCLALWLATALAGCSRKVPPAAAAADVKGLVQDTKRAAESFQGQPADRTAPEQIAKLTSLLDQLVRDMEARTQTSQQGGDVAQADTQVAADVAQLQQVQNTLPAAGAEEGTPSPAAREKKAILDRISENVAKIIQVAQQGKELASIVRPSRGDGRQVSESLQSSAAPSTAAPTDTEATSPPPSAAAPSDTEAAAQTVGPEDSDPVRQRPPQVKTPFVLGSDRCCDVVVNAALTGRLGRLVVAFPDGGNPSATRIAVYNAVGNRRLREARGALALDLLPGTYRVVISGKPVTGVTVQAGHDTRVRVGMIRVTAGSDARVVVMDVNDKTRFAEHRGSYVVGLPVGIVHLRINGQSEAVMIQDNKIAEF